MELQQNKQNFLELSPIKHTEQIPVFFPSAARR
jgi:hypothetical protein